MKIEKKYCFIFLALLCTSSFWGFCQSPEVLYKRGNQHYKEAKFEEAIQSYEAIINQGYQSAEVYYNLGNAFFKTENIPAAILNYERALKLHPGHQDAMFNLKVANLQVIDKVDVLPDLFFVKWWKEFASSYNSGTWATIFLMFLFASCGLLCAYLFVNTTYLKKVFFFSGLAMILVSLGCLFPAVHQYDRENYSQHGIIFAPNTYIKSGPNEASNDVFILHSGSKVAIQSKIDDWLKVKFDDDKIGWMKAGDLQEI